MTINSFNKLEKKNPTIISADSEKRLTKSNIYSNKNSQEIRNR